MGWLLFSLLLYPLLGWLFGSYTVLRWRRLTLAVLLQRLVITAAVSVIVVALARWLFNPVDAVWLVLSACAVGVDVGPHRLGPSGAPGAAAWTVAS